MENKFEQPDDMAAPKLSICIATYNRAEFIGETLGSILSQMGPGVELVVVDGASPDYTPKVMAEYTLRYPALRYYRETENSGIDGDYDKAIGYATGEYCWLMTDDDLLRPGAVRRVLDKLDGVYDLVVVNAEIRNVDFSRVLDEKLIKLEFDKEYRAGDEESLFLEATQGLSFIGCVVIRRDVWLARDRRSYFGSLFVHVGVIFQHLPITHAALIAEPLITIRYGNAMWTPRGLEIWIVKWPELVWSFVDFSDKAKSAVCPRGGWHLFKRLVFYRATGAYSTKEYNEILCAKISGLTRIASKFVAVVPVVLAGFFACIYSVILGGRGSRMVMYSLNSGQHKNAITRWAARSVGAC
nr:glycosyltransferase family 2 protein [Rhodoferax sp.]